MLGTIFAVLEAAKHCSTLFEKPLKAAHPAALLLYAQLSSNVGRNRHFIYNDRDCPYFKIIIPHKHVAAEIV